MTPATAAPVADSFVASSLRRMRLPVIAAPMFIVSGPELVIAQCEAGVIGAMPALNARPTALLDEWLHHIAHALGAWDCAHPGHPSAPYAINLIVHRSNPELDAALAICERHRVPIVITSLGAREDVNGAVHRWGGVTLHDVIDNRFARKAIEKGADGLIAVAAGAGGHAGRCSPFALAQEIRSWFPGPLALSGAIASGRSILAAEALGADFAYIGSPFIATTQANAAPQYKQAIVAGTAADIVYSDFFTGVHGNYLRGSILAAGLDPDSLPPRAEAAKFGSGGSKPWRDVWGAGQGIGAIDRIQPVGDFVAQLRREYDAARAEMAAKGALWAPCSGGDAP